MTLIPTLKQRLAQPSDLVDLAELKDLVGITVDGSNVTIGAMTTHATVAAPADAKSAIPAPAAYTHLTLPTTLRAQLSTHAVAVQQ